MFVALKKNDQLEIQDFDEFYIEALEHFAEVQKIQNEIKDLLSTAAELRHLHMTIQKTGITTELLAFVNKNNILSKTIPSMPSLESLSADMSIEDSKAALEGIADVIKSIYNKTIGKVAALVKNALTSLKIKFRSIPAIRLRVDNYVRDIAGKEFDEDRAQKIIGKFSKYSDLLALLDAAIHTDKVMTELFAIELPTTEDGFVKFKEELKKFVELHEANYRISEGDKGFKYHVLSSASLKDNGYTAESFHTIAAKIDEYVRVTLSTETAVTNTWNGYEDKIEKLLEDMSATYTKDGMEQTAYTKIGHMLIEAADKVLNIAMDLYGSSYRDGPVKGLKTLGNLRNAYK